MRLRRSTKKLMRAIRSSGAVAASSPLAALDWYVVAAERDGSDNLLDQTGGGRHALMPGGTANPVVLPHTGTDYFWLPGTSGNNLTTGGLSNSTAYDYKVFYLDGSSATGEETTSAGGVLTLGDTQTNFNVKKVTRIRVVADGADPDVATAVRDILASDADQNSTTFTEASSNAATVTINRSAAGYVTRVVQQTEIIAATDDRFDATSDAVWNPGTGDFTVIWVGSINDHTDGVLLGKKANSIQTNPGWVVRMASNGFIYFELANGSTEINKPGNIDFDGGGVAYLYDITWFAGVVSGTDVVVEDAVGTTAVSTRPTGSLDNSEPLDVLGGFTYSFSSLIGAGTKKGALTRAEISEIVDALITANGGTP